MLGCKTNEQRTGRRTGRKMETENTRTRTIQLNNGQDIEQPVEEYSDEQYEKIHSKAVQGLKPDKSGKDLTKEARRKKDKSLKVALIPVIDILDNPFQPRKSYGGIKELANSITSRGLLQPIIVVKLNDKQAEYEGGMLGALTKSGRKDKYVVVGGHRRLRAYRRLHRKTIPAIIRKESTMRDLALDLAIENAMRKDFSPFEKAEAIVQVLKTIPEVNDVVTAYSLVTIHKLFIQRDELSVSCKFKEGQLVECGKLLELIGVSHNTALKYLRLLDLPQEIAKKVIAINSNESMTRRRIEEGFITVTMAYEISRLKDNKDRTVLYEKTIENKWNAKALRAITDELLETGMEGKLLGGGGGTAKRRNSPDFKLKVVTNKVNDTSSSVWNFRSQIPLLEISMERVALVSALKNYKKSMREAILCVDKVLNEEKIARDEAIDGTKWAVETCSDRIEVPLKKGKKDNKQECRISLPIPLINKMGALPGDIIVVKIEAIKKQAFKERQNFIDRKAELFEWVKDKLPIEADKVYTHFEKKGWSKGTISNDITKFHKEGKLQRVLMSFGKGTTTFLIQKGKDATEFQKKFRLPTILKGLKGKCPIRMGDAHKEVRKISEIGYKTFTRDVEFLAGKGILQIEKRVGGKGGTTTIIKKVISK